MTARDLEAIANAMVAKGKGILAADESTGARFSFEDTLPIPTIGVHGEVPYGNFLYSAQFGGFYFDSSGFEGTGLRAQAGVTWRPYDNVGFFAGLSAIYADLEFKNEELDDLIIWGPAVGVEFRF